MTVLNRFKSNWKIVNHYWWLENYSNKKSYPICLEIDPANACPLNCRYCCWAKMRGEITSVLPKEKLFDIVEQAKRLRVIKISS